MKRVVFLEDLKEAAIRPASLYNKYTELLEKDVARLFPDPSRLVPTDCPGCGGKKYRKAFVKFGFQYRKCRACGSLFVSPRPTAEMLREFYRKSQARAFWMSQVTSTTKESRYRQQSLPTAQWVLEYVEEYLPRPDVFLDYSSKYADFLGLIGESGKFKKIISIAPEIPEPEKALGRDVKTYDDLGRVKEKASVFTAIEVLERTFDPAGFIKLIYDTCQTGGLCFLTTNTSSGFEYQVLEENSTRLYPPDRMNLLSIEAIQTRLAEAGFEVIELSTPGRTDVEIVRSTLANDPKVPLPDFIKYILKNRDESTWHSLQDFLQRNRLSSYVRVAARKKQG